ncbi:MAG: hypothetical protein MJ252_07265 [archaeon]|nr:hypothetical protein [archaeon]
MSVFTHPNVTYLEEELMFMEITTNNDDVFKFTTLYDEEYTTKYYSNTLSNGQRPIIIPLIKFEQFDFDNDDLIAEFKYKISVPLRTITPQAIRNIKLLFGFNYKINDYYVHWNNDFAPCIINIDTPYGASYVKTIGEIALKQNQLYPASKDGEKINPKIDSIDKVREDLIKKKIYPFYDYEKIVMPHRSDDFLVIEVTIKVPSFQEITFETPSFSGLKFAWMKYFAIFIPFFVIFRLFLYVMLKNDVVYSRKSNDLPRFDNFK